MQFQFHRPSLAHLEYYLLRKSGSTIIVQQPVLSRRLSSCNAELLLSKNPSVRCRVERV